MTRRSWLSAAAVSIGVLYLCAACSLLKKKEEDAGADAAPAAAAPDAAAEPAAAAEPTAKNAAQVGRFPSETKIAAEKAKVVADVTVARESPGSGPAVATLKKDVEVTKFAQRGTDFFLVTFADPKDASSTLMGWIPDEAFKATPAAPATCPKDQVKFVGQGCKQECSAAAKCPAGMGCTGLGVKFDAPGTVGFCEVGTDGGKPPAGDAGAAKDAGAATKDAGAAKDAGKK
jgi:hypothetical protein